MRRRREPFARQDGGGELGVRDGMIYLQVTRGVAPRNHVFPETPGGTVIAYCRPLPPVPAPAFEGEFDAMLAHQHIGDTVSVVTLGSASNSLSRRWQERLSQSPVILSLLDQDDALSPAEGSVDTGVEKFGALVGDGVRIGANAVVAPGALLSPGFRLALRFRPAQDLERQRCGS